MCFTFVLKWTVKLKRNEASEHAVKQVLIPVEKYYFQFIDKVGVVSTQTLFRASPEQDVVLRMEGECWQ